MDAQTARQKLLEEQESLAALRQQSEDARAPVMLDQQAVGRLSRMDAMQNKIWSLPPNNAANNVCKHSRRHCCA